MATPTVPRPLEALRVDLPLSDPDRHALDGAADEAFEAMAIAHPEACSTDATYPDWTPGGGH